ncbi:hypothetical protein ACLOJK_008348 [Asimina triloba]
MRRLFLYVLEARDLPPTTCCCAECGSLHDFHARIQLGKYKSRTRVVRNTRCPVWNEEFVFRVDDGRQVEEELVISVFHDNERHHHHDVPFLNGKASAFVGRVRIPVRALLGEQKETLPPTWFSLRPKPGKSNKTRKDCGAYFPPFGFSSFLLQDYATHRVPFIGRLPRLGFKTGASGLQVFFILVFPFFYQLFVY